MIVQGTPEWHQCRLGKVTASRLSDVTARTKTGWGASRSDYLTQLAIERLTGNPTESFTNAAMAWGTEKEPEARTAYVFATEADVMEVGFVDHPRIPMSGASPDGLVGADGLVEIKCPTSKTHFETLQGSGVPAKHLPQIQWQLACTGREWCDFVSYDPRFPPHLQLYVSRVLRDAEAIAEAEAAVSAFLGELDAKLAVLSALSLKEAA